MHNILHVQKSKKCKFHSKTGYEGPDGKQKYSSNVSLTLALDGGG
jgi:hypothetical protein